MNILFTCAGRRNYLLKYFKHIADLKVIACDASIYAPAFNDAQEYFIVPEIFEPNYLDALLDEAIRRNINAIIPLNDLELPLLSQNRDLFLSHGINIIVSNPDVIEICFDKLKTLEFAGSLSIKSIPTFVCPEEANKYLSRFPDTKFVIKPRWGTASVGIEYPKDGYEVEMQYNILRNKFKNAFRSHENCSEQEKCILIQKKIIGTEYGIDVINDLKGNYKATLIRKKVAMRSGETDKAETIYDDKLTRLGERIGNQLKHIGIIDCDLIVENENIYLLEINPRFGGGYPFSHFAGANVPEAYVAWLKGKPTPQCCFNYQPGILAAKTDVIVKLNPC
jgi:carbamoyl-phosphate synthase large subunit